MAPIAQRVFKSPTRAVDLAAAADEAPHAVALQSAWGAWRAKGVRRGGRSGGQVPPRDPPLPLPRCTPLPDSAVRALPSGALRPTHSPWNQPLHT